jgi:hypothetical protein
VAVGAGGFATVKATTGHPPKTDKNEQTNPGAEQQSLSAEAQKFVAEFGSRYSDPVSTYFAEKAYNPDIDLGPIMTDEYINTFNSEDEQMTDGKSDMLGFKKSELPLNEKVDQQVFIDVFNKDFVPGLNNLMLYFARNPSPEARQVIRDEFEKYYSTTGDKGQPAAFTFDDQEIANLMNTFEAVAEKYGSAANYSVAQASAYNHTDSQEGTIFGSTAVDSGHVEKYGQKIEYYFTGSVDITVNVDVFKGDKSTRVTETLKDTELTIWHQPAIQGMGANRFTDISIGQRKIAE